MPIVCSKPGRQFAASNVCARHEAGVLRYGLLHLTENIVRYALISDIHANLHAPDAVLTDIDQSGDVEATTTAARTSNGECLSEHISKSSA